MPDSPFVVVCGGCGQRLRIPEARRGDRARCPRCRAVFPAQEADAGTGGPGQVGRRGRPWSRRSFGAALGAAGGAAAVGFAWKFLSGDGSADPLAASLSLEEFTGASFTGEPILPEVPPRLTPVLLPSFLGSSAIWGAIGRDGSGNLWFAVSAHDVPERSAHLYEYDPETGRVEPRGDVLAELRRAGLYRDGEQQPKIHSRIVHAGDGQLYFTSMDEPRPGEVGERPPVWGSHLWRLRLPGRSWEHLLAAPEGLIGLAGGGRYVYALGFPNHTLWQFDCQTGRARKTEVGSVEGHVSRNLLIDRRGHAYVPRLRYVRPGHAEHTLVEFDASLREVGRSPLPNYQQGEAAACHGIIAFQQMAHGSLVFTTHPGRLFRLAFNARGPARLEDLGWFHPGGPAYAPSLFSPSGRRWLFGVTWGASERRAGFEWVYRDLDGDESRAVPLPLPKVRGSAPGDALLYGCQTRDRLGNYYLAGGGYLGRNRREPLLLQVGLPGAAV